MGSMDSIRAVEKRGLKESINKKRKFVEEHMTGEYDIEAVAKEAQRTGIYDVKLKLPMVVCLLEKFHKKHF